MATVSTFIGAPTQVAPGGTARLSVAFTTNPGTPDRILHGELHDPSGAVAATVQVDFQGTPAEPTPTVAMGPTPGQWCIVIDGGTLARAAGNDFDWHL